MESERTMQGMSEQAAQKAREMAEKAKSAGNAAWERAKMGYDVVQDRTREAGRATDRLIRANPYQSIGIAFGVGLLLGFLLKRD